MEHFRDKVAVITGASSGIGFAIAERCAREGMIVVLSGINYDNLMYAAQALEPTGATTYCIQADVSKEADINALAEATLDAFGSVDLLVNSAGVAAGGSVWESSLADWEWVIDVNLWGMLYPLHTFVPIMLAQNTESHIVNICSTAGLVPYHPLAPYQVTKHAVLALSENLYHSFAQRKVKTGVTVVCPGFVKTRIADAERNRPPELQNLPDETFALPDTMVANFHKAVDGGMPPEEVAEATFRAIQNRQFYVLTHPEYGAEVQKRMEAILRQA
ncbi:MAG TPA: SDR family NAD(P)-dependent oxidoreductase [Aggregatilinea sp.]|uniref:SDR family NAD(P)-dependent oxidoreductase n=1 Tax=Aggregatilinea sp. TaxID=2806333 RepID=UPI002C7C1070|nr:SDR family NAD(P)-dependent oxidoreductase [Aggregatilinea sp.]HML23864.1 SDR family NAD(P)-dependent oxidoreductase [Aggregatilinea sp.]